MANAVRYDVLVDGHSIYCGPLRSAKLVYDSIIKYRDLCINFASDSSCEFPSSLFLHVVLAFH